MAKNDPRPTPLERIIAELEKLNTTMKKIAGYMEKSAERALKPAAQKEAAVTSGSSGETTPLPPRPPARHPRKKDTFDEGGEG